MAQTKKERIIPAEQAAGLGIRAKIGIIIALLAVSIGVATAAYLYIQMRGTLTEEIEKRGRALASGLATSATNPILTNSKGVLKTIADDILKEEAVVYVVILNDEGKSLFNTFEGEKIPDEVADAAKATNKTAADRRNLKLRGIEILNISGPVVEGKVGSVHIGMSTAGIAALVRNMVLVMLTVLVFVLVGGWIVAYVISNRIIVAPIQDVMSVARSIGQGDLSREVKVTSQDEIGQLGVTFNETVKRLRHLVQTEDERNQMQRQVMDLLSIVSAAAEGDLTKQAVVTADALGSLADAFNVMVDGLTILINQVKDASLEIDGASRKVLSAADGIRRSAEEQTVHISQASRTVNAMSQSMTQVAQSAESAAQASATAIDTALKGETSVAETIRGMHRIRSTVQTTSKKVKSLGERSMEIGAIIEVINDIATQTNLLALNAAIEAARAGEHGKGFAVVADEVRKLAERSAKATKDIANLIKGIQVETNEVVTAMEEGTREVEEGTRLADQAGSALKGIESVVRRTAQSVTEISQAARVQAKSTEEVVRTMEGMSQATRQTVESVRGASDTIRGLAELSGRLVSSVGRFKIKEKRAEPAGVGVSAALRPARQEEEIDLGFLETK
ncbi:MAG: HAMP domain-containing protein [Nitrospirae bacterium]|nr:HAMP domain-containing protein [Nitrospirota bacterium]